MYLDKDESNHVEIKTVLSNYFEGYLKAESEVLLKAFHQDAKLFSVEQGKLDVTLMDDWVKNLNERKEKRDIREATTEILGIDVTGTAAIAKVKLVFPKFYFVDYLSLLQVEDQWVVINKIYSVNG